MTMGSNVGQSKSRLEYCLQTFPSAALLLIMNLTNKNPAGKGKPLTTRGKILNFFGILILITRFEFSSQRTLWATTATSKYKPAAALGKTGMPQNHFDDLFSHIRFSDQPDN